MTSKQLEILKKLTALANNNPNENEANLAARKVCRLLQESNFILTVNSTWNDVKRTTEPEIKSTRSSSNPSRYGDWVRQHYNTRYETWEDIFRYDPTKSNWTGTTYDGRTNKAKQEPRILKCRKCGTEVSTNYVGESSTFTCFGCWAK